MWYTYALHVSFNNLPELFYVHRARLKNRGNSFLACILLLYLIISNKDLQLQQLPESPGWQ